MSQLFLHRCTHTHTPSHINSAYHICTKTHIENSSIGITEPEDREEDTTKAMDFATQAGGLVRPTQLSPDMSIKVDMAPVTPLGNDGPDAVESVAPPPPMTLVENPQNPVTLQPFETMYSPAPVPTTFVTQAVEPVCRPPPKRRARVTSSKDDGDDSDSDYSEAPRPKQRKTGSRQGCPMPPGGIGQPCEMLDPATGAGGALRADGTGDIAGAGMPPEPTSRKGRAGLRKSTATRKNNNRVALRELTCGRRCVSDVVQLDPPLMVRLKIVNGVSTEKVLRKNKKSMLIDIGQQFGVLQLFVEGHPKPDEKVWVITTNKGVVPVPAAAVERAMTQLTIATRDFQVIARGRVRRDPQKQGTRPKAGEPVVECYGIFVGDAGRPLWVDCSLITPDQISLMQVPTEIGDPSNAPAPIDTTGLSQMPPLAPALAAPTQQQPLPTVVETIEIPIGPQVEIAGPLPQPLSQVPPQVQDQVPAGPTQPPEQPDELLQQPRLLPQPDE